MSSAAFMFLFATAFLAILAIVVAVLFYCIKDDVNLFNQGENKNDFHYYSLCSIVFHYCNARQYQG